MNSKLKYLFAIVVVVLLFMGVCYSANNTLPDSKLYVLKVNINEKLIGLTKTKTFDKASYAIELANKRLQESQDLRQTGKLTQEILDETRNSFNQQTVLAQEYIIDLTQKESVNSIHVLKLNEELYVAIENAKNIYNIDTLEVLPEDAPVKSAITTSSSTSEVVKTDTKFKK